MIRYNGRALARPFVIEPSVIVGNDFDKSLQKALTICFINSNI